MKQKETKWEPVGFSSVEHALKTGAFKARLTYCGLVLETSHRLEHFTYRKCKRCLAAIKKEGK